MSNHRIDPDELLQRAQKVAHDSQQGKLKIYLGAAPGVGKTYEMLQDAYEQRAKQLDVVVGIVESHGRDRIESMLKDFEVIPRQTIIYREKTYTEFDLDAALKRNPGLILVDEMAHTNVSGLRHEKRWQDIQELLDRGIDVYTTLNVQHIESLKDDVSQIIQAPIKETVPDLMIERADTLELIDLPVDDLLKRLHEGKIYIPKQAEFAVSHYFRRGNLIALRELALRTTAQAVETEVLLYRKSEGIQKIWPTRDKILVCVGANPESLKLIRTAKQMASNLQAEWIAVYVDVPHLYDTKVRRNRAIEHLRFAEQLGAETHVLVASDIVKEVMRYARERNVTQIMVWKQATQKWWHIFKRYTANVLLANCGEIDVYIVTGDVQLNERSLKKPTERKITWKYYGIALVVVLLISLFNILLEPYLAISNFLMIYLLGIVLVAGLGQIGPALFASILSIGCYDFLFLTPPDKFKLMNYRDIFTLAIMFVVTQVISYFTLLKHRKAEIANQIQQQTGALYTFSRQLLLTRTTDKLLKLGTAYIADIFKAEVKIFLPNRQQLQCREGGRFKPIADAKEQSVAQWVYEMGKPAGHGTETLSSNKALYLPLISSVAPIGVLKIEPQKDTLYSPEQQRLLEACATQLTLALEVDRLQEKTRKREIKIEIDIARNTLLKHISHHLNSPLQVILTAIRSTKGKNKTFDPSSIRDELNCISLINNNMLQLIKFESEAMELNKKELHLHSVIVESVVLFHQYAQHKEVQINIPENLPHIFADKAMLQEALVNLLDNANKFSPEKTSIEIAVEYKTRMKVSILNQGSDIANDEMEHWFKKFYRGKGALGQHGLGLGLTLCQKIIEAHGGKIWAENLTEQGLIAFCFTLPVKEKEA